MVNKRYIKYFWLIFFSIIMSSGCKSGAPPSSSRVGKIIPIVKCKTVETKDMKEIFGFTGDIRGEDEAVVYSKVPGKLLEKKLREGDTVKKGDAIITVNRDEVGYTFEPAPVLSPLDGLVGRIYLDKGDNITTSIPIARVVKIDSVRAKIDVVERYLTFVTAGQSADITVDAYPEEVFNGTVSTISPVLDLSTRTAVVEINIPNPDHKLKPGMFTRVSVIKNELKGAAVIPKDALLTYGSETFVFVVTDGKAEKRSVTPGIREDNMLQIKDGLSPGDNVVVRGQYNLDDGAVVKVEELQ